MGRLVQLGLAVAGAALALGLSRLPGSELPQVVKGEDVLSVAFGDARTVLSQMMVRKSDSYFHGGIDIDCSCKDCRDGEHHHEDHDHEGHAVAQPDHRFPDPWRWINAHVRAPQRHVHLDGEKTVELLPLYWAALRADPHNVDGWTTAVFIAAEDLHDAALAERLIAEAKAANPESAEIAFAEGRSRRLVGDGAGARTAFVRAKDLLRAKTAGGEGLTDDERALETLLDAFLGEPVRQERNSPSSEHAAEPASEVLL